LGAKFTVVQRIEEESTYVLVHDASGEFYELKPYQNFRRI
jgi:predicted methyltransferase